MQSHDGSHAAQTSVGLSVVVESGGWLAGGLAEGRTALSSRARPRPRTVCSSRWRHPKQGRRPALCQRVKIIRSAAADQGAGRSRRKCCSVTALPRCHWRIVGDAGRGVEIEDKGDWLRQRNIDKTWPWERKQRSGFPCKNSSDGYTGTRGTNFLPYQFGLSNPQRDSLTASAQGVCGSASCRPSAAIAEVFSY